MSDLPPFEEPIQMLDPAPSGSGDKNSDQPNIPRRGYEGVPRPMAPPPPPPNRYPPPPQPPQAAPPTPTYPVGGEYAPAPKIVTPIARPEPQFRRRDNGLYFPCWSLVVMLLIVATGSLSLFYIAVSSEGFVPGDQKSRIVQVSATPNGQTDTTNILGNNPQVIVVTSQPISTRTVPTAAPIQSTPVPQAIPTETAIPSAVVGCPLNAEVRVVGTGTVGLSIRSEPIQGDNILQIARDGERLKIVEGPQFSTGVSGQIEYCRVQGIDNPSLDGWAAREYLVEPEQFDG